MTSKRECRYVPLSKPPLVLVLCQVRFSPVLKMPDYIPEIQEAFRRLGFPIERAGKIPQLTITPGGVEVVEKQRWEFRTKDERWSITVLDGSVALHTTGYERFEGFAEHLVRAVEIVLAKTEHDRLGLVERVGLRYVNLVRPRQNEDYRVYLQPGFHGLSGEVFRPHSHRVQVQSSGRTKVGDTEGSMVVRVSQNDQGFDLPPDLVGGVPNHTSRAKAGELVTLIDMDHFIEGKFEPDAERVVSHAFTMHDHLVETFHEHVVTEQAVEVWR